MSDYGRHFATRATPQVERARADQRRNHAGGFAFEVDLWTRLDRFLVLGSDGGTYYVGERALTRDNALAVLDCLRTDGLRTVARIAEVSESGRAPKNDAAIFALAMAAADESLVVRKAALAALPRVARTATHLFHFVRDVEHFRRWGRGLRRAIADWYLRKEPDALAYQVVKYGQRDGWSHADLLRLSHAAPPVDSPAHAAIFRWIAAEGELGARAVLRKQSGGASRVDHYDAVDRAALPALVDAFERVRRATEPSEVVALVREHRLTHEMVPSEWKDRAEVWEALLERMPLGALLRNLAKMTHVDLLRPMGAASARVAEALSSADALRKARIHPIAVLSALKTYAQGRGEKGKLVWTPVPAIVEALDAAFDRSFRFVEPTGKKHLLALDVSGSMSLGTIAGVAGLTPRDASAAMAMATVRVEKEHHVMAFSDRLVPVSIGARDRLDDVVGKTARLPFGGTDCAQPMLWAADKRVEVDVFVIYTDSETWFGAVHPFQALRAYRERMGRPAKVVVVGMTATKFTIADPTDAGMLDVVGFDAAAPAVMADFAR